MPIEKRDSYITGTNDYKDTANSDIVVITAGIPRKPGMSRDDLLNTNYGIMKAVVGEVVKYSPNCILDYCSRTRSMPWPKPPTSSAASRVSAVTQHGRHVLDSRLLSRVHRHR